MTAPPADETNQAKQNRGIPRRGEEAGGYGRKETGKENHQGCLSRSVKPFSETAQTVSENGLTAEAAGWRGAIGAAPPLSSLRVRGRAGFAGTPPEVGVPGSSPPIRRLSYRSSVMRT